jgi:RimJ/RimL family protein N-acetyltransferase
MGTPHSEITIRRATAADVEALRELRLEGLRSHPVAFGTDYETDSNRSRQEWEKRLQDSAIYMAWDGETAVGMAGIYPGRSRKTGHQASVWGVYVRPGFRDRGLAGKLIEHCLQWARESQLRIVYIAAASTNTAAIRCYARCGFSVYGLQPKALLYDGVYYDELLMAQAL